MSAVALDTRTPQPAAVPAAVTHQIEISGTWRDALSVPEIAERLFGDRSDKTCARVRHLIRTGELFALSTGAAYFVPVSAYVAYLRGEKYPS